MFADAVSFNIDLSPWAVSNVVDMREMFSGASSFDQELCWDLSHHETDDCTYEFDHIFYGYAYELSTPVDDNAEEMFLNTQRVGEPVVPPLRRRWVPHGRQLRPLPGGNVCSRTARRVHRCGGLHLLWSRLFPSCPAKPVAMSPAPQVPSLPKDPAAARPALPAPFRSPRPLPAAIRCALVAVTKAVRARALLVVRAISRSTQARRAATSARVVLTLTLALRLVPLAPPPRRTLRPEHRHRSAICSAPRDVPSTSIVDGLRSCPSGKFSDAFGRTECATCGAGAAPSTDQTSCNSCNEGQYASDDGSCTNCESGKYAPVPLDGECLICEAGFYTGVATGSSTCTACSAGSSSSGTAEQCSDCEAGKSSGSAASSCVDCSIGTYAANAKSSTCTNCNPERTQAARTTLRDCHRASSGLLPHHARLLHRHLRGQCEVIDLHQLQPRNVRQQPQFEQLPERLLGGIDLSHRRDVVHRLSLRHVVRRGRIICVHRVQRGHLQRRIVAGVLAMRSGQIERQSSIGVHRLRGRQIRGRGGGQRLRRCPGDRFSTPGATSCDLCNAGFYYDIDQTCVVCPDGTECPTDGGSTQESLTLQEGCWRIDATFRTTSTNRPIDGAMHRGFGDDVNESSGSRRQRELLDESSAYGDRYCAKGYEGPLCGVCSSNSTTTTIRRSVKSATSKRSGPPSPSRKE